MAVTGILSSAWKEVTLVIILLVLHAHPGLVTETEETIIPEGGLNRDDVITATTDIAFLVTSDNNAIPVSTGRERSTSPAVKMITIVREHDDGTVGDTDTGGKHLDFLLQPSLPHW